MGETNFQPRKIPRSGSKAKDGEKREKERLNDSDNNGQTHGADKRPEGWVNLTFYENLTFAFKIFMYTVYKGVNLHFKMKTVSVSAFNKLKSSLIDNVYIHLGYYNL